MADLTYQFKPIGLWTDPLTPADALGLEALRAVDRYGVSKRGEQYRGWTAITGGTGSSLFATRDDAETWMRKAGAEEGIDTWASWEALYKALAKRMHPDVAGNAELWERLDDAAAFIGIRENSNA